MDLESLSDHLKRGGAATLNHPATYSVAEGSVIAPARYASRSGSGSEFVFERRHVNGGFKTTALIDSKGSQSNRAEEGLITARREDGPANLIPAIKVRYKHTEMLDMELPHRAVDAHVRAASQSGEPVVKATWYRELRDSGAADLSPLFLASPVSLMFGAWDSMRNSGQLRLRSLFVSELFGVVDEDERRVSKRSGARLDPLGQDIYLTPDAFEELLEQQRDEMSAKKVKSLEGELSKARKSKQDRLSASAFVLGGIPPGLESPFGVSVPEVRRVRSYSLAGLRRLRFGGSVEEDVAARTALLAALLLGATYADAEPEIRAYCDLGAPVGQVMLDGELVELELSIEACNEFLNGAISRLPDRLQWDGQLQVVDGNSSLQPVDGNEEPA